MSKALKHYMVQLGGKSKKDLQHDTTVNFSRARLTAYRNDFLQLRCKDWNHPRDGCPGTIKIMLILAPGKVYVRYFLDKCSLNYIQNNFILHGNWAGMDLERYGIDLNAIFGLWGLPQGLLFKTIHFPIFLKMVIFQKNHFYHI